MTSKLNSSSISTPSKIQSQLLTRSPDSINTVESDDDSGIVAITNGQRIGSTSSNSDEDQLYKEKVSQPTSHTMGSGAKHRVRFDDELHLSEQNMRRSCRKLFATLFHQNKENYDEESSMNSHVCSNSFNEKNSLLPSCHCHCFTQTLPHKKLSKSITSVANCRTSSQLNLSINMTHDLNNIDKSQDDSISSGLLLQTVPQSHETHRCSYGLVTNMNSLPTRRLNQTKSHSVWSINQNSDRNDSNDVTLNCSAALSRIKSMSDRLESSSMVNAFARPVLIQNCDPNPAAAAAADKDKIYETIFPMNQKNDKSMYSSKGQIKKWLNSEKVESFREEPETAEVSNHQSKTDLIRSLSLKSSPKSRKSILKVNQPMPDMMISSLDLTNKALISADQVYPDRDDNEDTDEDEVSDDEEEEKKDMRGKLSQRFSSSYSAGDGVIHRLPNKMLKPAISETNLNESNSNRKSFLQRFKSAITRAFTNDKLTKQHCTTVEPIRDGKSRSISQTDLRINVNPNGSNSCVPIINKSRTDNKSESPSFVKNLKTRISIRRNVKVDMKANTPERKLRSTDKVRSSDKDLVSRQESNSYSVESYSDHNNQVWGELIKLNSDSSQVIQIHRKKGKAFGFFVARGTVNNVKGVFVSRMKDEQIQKSLVGVLEIGDEILAIDGESVKDGNIMQVNQLIANKETIRLTIIPYMNNKYL